MDLVPEEEWLRAEWMRYSLDGFSVGGGGAEGGEWTISSGALRIGKGWDWKRGKSALGISFASSGIR
jgi:hypothetical protein